MSMDGRPDMFYRATAMEMAAGWVPGRGPKTVVDLDRSTRHPVEAIEHAILPALQQQPCVVGFSGGRDSSVVLAVAARLAAREGLPPPIAATKVFPGQPETEESEWQELVIRHLGIEDWVQEEFHDEFDLLGPAALKSLRAHGPLWPGTCHNRAPQIAIAANGWYLGGEGGDEMLGEFRATPWVQMRAGGGSSAPRTAKEVVKVFGPRPVRRALLKRRLGSDGLRPWLRPAAEEWFRDSLIEDDVSRPLTYSSSLQDFLRRRAVHAALRNLRAIGRTLNVTYGQPLLDPKFAAALAHLGGRFGYLDRTTTMRAVFGDLLPRSVLERESKATFNSVYAHRHTRAFIETWDGSGLAPDLIDADALLKTWQQPVIHGGTFQLLHLAWLHANPEVDPGQHLFQKPATSLEEG